VLKAPPSRFDILSLSSTIGRQKRKEKCTGLKTTILPARKGKKKKSNDIYLLLMQAIRLPSLPGQQEGGHP